MINRRQFDLLSERYFECLLGDFPSLLWMIGQPPLIAALIILRWKSWQATETLYFVMALSVLWFGCINACGEIAKERAVYRRERLLGLDPFPYLASKGKILCLFGLLETGVFLFMLHRWLDLDLSLLPAFAALVLSYFAGMSLGLFLSRWCRTLRRAILSVPVAIIPQIVFSKFVLPEDSLKGAASKFEKAMPVKWGFEALRNARSGQIDWNAFLKSSAILTAIAFAFLILTLLHLWAVSEEE
jgi:hypothetical protein